MSKVRRAPDLGAVLTVVILAFGLVGTAVVRPEGLTRDAEALLLGGVYWLVAAGLLAGASARRISTTVAHPTTMLVAAVAVFAAVEGVNALTGHLDPARVATTYAGLLGTSALVVAFAAAMDRRTDPRRRYLTT